ncbi:MAG: hypothetical protein V4693_12050 [Pseudomonadota bacterium]
MSFATPAPDMSNRQTGPFVSTIGKRIGRPKRTERDEIQTVAWFHFVRIALGETAPGAMAKRAQTHFDARGVTSNHVLSKRWYRYRDGLETPDAHTLKLVDEIAPGSLDFFQAGPGDLWLALWAYRIERWSEDAAERLLDVREGEIDFLWLTRLIATWTKRAELVGSGVPGTFVDGFYEAIFMALNRSGIKAPLEQFGVWARLVEIITHREAEHLRCDVMKARELHAVAIECGIGNAIETYVKNPLGFLHAASIGHTSQNVS